MAIDLRTEEQDIVQRRENVARTLEAIKAWPYWEEVFLNCVKEPLMSYEAFAAAVHAGDDSQQAFDQALVSSQMTRAAFDRYLPEYQKFMALCAHYPGIGMVSTGVDALWHGHLLITDRYEQFCLEYIGRFVHHLPCSLYPIYGIVQGNSSCIAKCVPQSCKDEGGGCKAGTASRDENPEATAQGIRQAVHAFIQTYTETYGAAPEAEIWDQLS